MSSCLYKNYLDLCLTLELIISPIFTFISDFWYSFATEDKNICINSSDCICPLIIKISSQSLFTCQFLGTLYFTTVGNRKCKCMWLFRESTLLTEAFDFIQKNLNCFISGSSTYSWPEDLPCLPQACVRQGKARNACIQTKEVWSKAIKTNTVAILS